MIEGARRRSRYDAFHRIAASRKWATGRQLMQWLDHGALPRPGQKRMQDPEVERLAKAALAGGTLKIDSEGRPYVES